MAPAGPPRTRREVLEDAAVAVFMRLSLEKGAQIPPPREAAEQSAQHLILALGDRKELAPQVVTELLGPAAHKKKPFAWASSIAHAEARGWLAEVVATLDGRRLAGERQRAELAKAAEAEAAKRAADERARQAWLRREQLAGVVEAALVDRLQPGDVFELAGLATVRGRWRVETVNRDPIPGLPVGARLVVRELEAKRFPLRLRPADVLSALGDVDAPAIPGAIEEALKFHARGGKA